jgi:HK97 family phage major capsid protein
MDNWKDLLGQADALFSQAKAILSDTVPDEDAEDGVRPATDDEKENVMQMMEDARGMKEKALQLQHIDVEGQEIARASASTKALTLAQEQNDEVSELTNADANHPFKSWGEYLYTVFSVSHNIKTMEGSGLVRFDGDAPMSTKDMAEGAGATGGFLVPVEFQAQLQAVMAEETSIRGRCTIIPMRRAQVNIPVLDQTGTAAGRPHWFGGMRFYWAAEATEKTSTEPTFRQVSLVAHKLIGYTRASDELLDDSAISLSAFLSGPLGFAGGVRWMEEYAFLMGTGAGQPLGVITAINTPTIAVGRAAANAVSYADLANMMENFLPSGRGVWYISQSLMSDIIQLSGPTGNPSYVWATNAADGIPGTLLGLPVVWTEKVPRVGTTGDVLLADWRYYLVGDRQATTVESTKFDRWAYDQTSWRVVHRVDGQPWLSAPLTYQDGTTQVSPFVVLSATVAT